MSRSRREDIKTRRPKWVGIRESVFRHNSAAGPRAGSGFATKSAKRPPNPVIPTGSKTAVAAALPGEPGARVERRAPLLNSISPARSPDARRVFGLASVPFSENILDNYPITVRVQIPWYRYYHPSREGKQNIMKKLTLLAFIALSLFAARTTNQIFNPIPTCEPCPWVR